MTPWRMPPTPQSGGNRLRKGLRAARFAAAGAAVAGLLALSGPARADDHDPDTAGHPLRIVAYALHPFGVIVDRLLLRPAHWAVHFEPLRTLFGHEHYDDES